MNVNAEQKTAIEHGRGPLLIVAGAGTGKTTVVTERIAWLILKQGIPTDGILGLTFTDKAATEMEERVDRLLPYGYVNLWVSTFHAFAERILREHAIDIGLPADFRILSQTEQWLLVRRNFDRFDLDYYRPLGNPTRFIASLVRHFSRLEDEDITPEQYVEYARSLKLDRDEEQFARKRDDGDAASDAQRIEEAAAAYATYRQLLLDESSLDFGTLITYAIELFKKRPAILGKYREQFRYLLVDEFQDTNWSQYELIKLLAAPKNNLTVVGDDDQSIYKFRGASISNILEFRKDFPKAKQVVLTKNYRSRQNILDLSYAFIQLNNPNRLETALNVAQKGKRALARPVSKRLEAMDREAGTIEFIHVGTQEEETKRVTEKIADLQKKEHLPWSEFAILVRANDQAEAFSHSFDVSGIPYQFVASKGLYRKPDILDLVSYLRLLDNYHESPALYRMLNLQAFGVKPDDVIELTAYSRRKGQSLYQSLVQSRAIPNLQAVSRKGVDDILHLIRFGTTYCRNHKITEVLFTFLKDSGIIAELGKSTTHNVLERIATINKFLSEVSEFEKLHSHAKIQDFLEYFQLKLDSGDAGSMAGTFEEDIDAVRIMTVHGAKGLEFTHVFVVQLVDRRFPTNERKDPIEIPEPLVREILPEGDIHLQEERRLLYVAMTRAKRGLYLTAAADYGGVLAKNPSRFLYELGFLQEKPERAGKRLLVGDRIDRPREHATDVRFLGTKFSFSALRSYEKCPWQFRYAYVLRIPVAGSGLLSFGESLHTTLQRFFQLWKDRKTKTQTGLFGSDAGERGESKPLVSLDELMNLYEESFISEWYADDAEREKFRERGRNSLKLFYEEQVNAMPEVLGLEQQFNFKLDRYTITGKMDRVDSLGENQGTKKPNVGIVDYKSGHAREMDRADRYQLLIYALAAQDPHILNAEVKRLSYHFLEDNKVVDIPVTEAELKKTGDWIRAIIGEIQTGRFDATPGQQCKFCDYRAICEYRDPNY